MERVISTKKLTHDIYEQRLFDLEIDFFPIEQYINSATPIKHTCLKGHIWKVSPNNILHKRSGCAECSGKLKRTPEKYVQDLLSKNIKIKPIEKYISIHTVILHECPEGHKWKASPANILHGKFGCPYCSVSGFNKEKEAILYFIKFTYEGIDYYKIGVTNKSEVSDRFQKSEWKNLNMSILWTVYLSGDEAYKLEQQLIKDNAQYLINTQALTSGNTETFSVLIDKPL